MPRVSPAIAVLGALALAGCVTPPPTGPSVAAMPAQGKTFEQFQQDDATCRQYASSQIGNSSPEQAANESAVNSAIVGTAIGAAAGAALGAAAGNPALGAAAGAGGGLLFGSAAGVGASQASGAALQHRYDVGYIQCMAAKGESVPTVQAGARPYPYYPYYGYYYPGYPAYYYPAY
ncbi:MAG TPA: glycine zipper family protein [Alphaproteobacteria bacterium]|nr:glycine zipper family protein [Alphaproteobacteria bacterium]